MFLFIIWNRNTYEIFPEQLFTSLICIQGVRYVYDLYLRRALVARHT